MQRKLDELIACKVNPSAQQNAEGKGHIAVLAARRQPSEKPIKPAVNLGLVKVR